MIICSVRALLFHADRRTAMTDIIAPFRNFANSPKNSSFYLQVNYGHAFLTVLVINRGYLPETV